ncbi:MAG TPA: Ig-like domain-containing protein [bacterium]|nr:Ig-like domain-containing protein [bacterium]
MRAFPLLFSTAMLLTVDLCSETKKTPAFVVSNSPADQQTGVPKDVHIVLTFNKAIDHTKGETAYDSSTVGLRPQDVTFQWSSDSKTLTVIPNAPLVYATGGFPASVAAKKYNYQFDSRPIDEQPVFLDATFSTLRQITEAGTPCGLFYNRIATGPVVGLGSMTAGDDVGNNRLVTAFDVPLPAVNLGSNGSIVSATLHLTQGPTTGTPYSVLANGANTDELQHVVFVTSSGSDVFTTPTLDTPAGGIFSASGSATPALLDVTTDVAADWTRGVVEWRIAFANASNNDGAADQQQYGNCDPASVTGPTLDVTWTQP